MNHQEMVSKETSPALEPFCHGRKYAILILLSSMAGIMYLTPFLRYSFYDQMVDALHLTDAQMGMIGSFYGIFTLFLYLLAGVIAEKFALRPIVIFSGLGMLLTTVWYALFPGYLALCLIHGLYGVFGCGIYWSAYLKAIRNLGPSKEQGRLFGGSDAIRGATQVIVSLACLALVNRYAENGVGFRLMLILNAAVYLILTIASFFVLPKEQPKAEDPEQEVKQAEKMQGGLLKRSGALLKTSGIWLVALLILSTYCVWATANTYLGTFTTRILGFSQGTASILSIIRSNVIMLLAGLTSAIFMDRFRTKGKGLMVFWGLTMVLTAAILVTFGVPVICAILTLLMAFVLNVVKSSYWSTMDEAGIPRNSTGLATGLISTMAYTPEIFAYIAVPAFLAMGESSSNAAQGFTYMFLWMLGFSALGFVVAFLLNRKAAGKRRADASCRRNAEPFTEQI